MTRPDKTYRAFRLEGLGVELPISRAVAINADIPTVLNLERLPDGTYKLLYNAKVITDIRQLTSISVVRSKHAQD